MSNLSPGYILKLKERFENGSDDYNLTKQGLKEFFKCKDHEVDVVSIFFWRLIFLRFSNYSTLTTTVSLTLTSSSAG